MCKISSHSRIIFCTCRLVDKNGRSSRKSSEGSASGESANVDVDVDVDIRRDVDDGESEIMRRFRRTRKM